MTRNEREWAKQNGLKRTRLKTIFRGSKKVVYRANDGKLYFRRNNRYQQTFRDMCF